MNTSAETIFVRENVKVSDYTYGPLNIEHYYPNAKLSIGKYCSIAKKVTFMLGGNHGTKAITTYPFGPRVYNKFGGGYMEPPRWNVNIVIEIDYSKINHVHKDVFMDDWHVEITEENVDEIIAHFVIES